MLETLDAVRNCSLGVDLLLRLVNADIDGITLAPKNMKGNCQARISLNTVKGSPFSRAGHLADFGPLVGPENKKTQNSDPASACFGTPRREASRYRDPPHFLLANARTREPEPKPEFPFPFSRSLAPTGFPSFFVFVFSPCVALTLVSSDPSVWQRRRWR